jgi:EAL domain-containing protein (putative c-di-GMP-specific phosphodiesterase class I)/DICT domain-containing protein
MPDLPPIRSVYQPIVDLLDGGTVGYESLVRGAEGAELATPAQLFGWAARNGRLADLDWACRISALRGALDGGLPAGSGLFINVEPAAFTASIPREMADLAERARAAGLQVVAEVTERSLAADPAALLRFADIVRVQGWALAVDDVGADVESLAMMPFLAPEVVKLDLQLIQDRTTVDVAQIMNAVNAHAAREGALVLAEGIETSEHEELARSMGAHLGQGWLYGRPEPLPDSHVASPLYLASPRRRWSDLRGAAVPWDLVKDDQGVRRSRKPLLAAISRHLERQALTGDPATVVVGSFQRAAYFTPATARRYTALATTAALVAVLAESMPAVPVPGVRGHDVLADDPLLQKWTIAVVGPHFAGALVARDVGDHVPEAERRFGYVVTYDRDTVVAAAALMMRRLGRRADDVDGARALRQQPSRLELLTRAVSATDNGIVIADVRAEDMPLIYVNPQLRAAHRLCGGGDPGPQLPVPAGSRHRSDGDPGSRRASALPDQRVGHPGQLPQGRHGLAEPGHAVSDARCGGDGHPHHRRPAGCDGAGHGRGGGAAARGHRPAHRAAQPERRPARGRAPAERRYVRP